MRVSIRCNYTIEISNCKMETITAAFRKVLILFLRDFVVEIVSKFAREYMREKDKPFKCERCGNNEQFIWKTLEAKKTRIRTIFGEIIVGQMQVQCKRCGKKMYITRKLLGIGPRRRMSEGTKKILALMGGLTSFRVSEKILKMMGVAINKMAVWRSVQEVGKKIEFGLDVKEAPRGQADGTGIAIQGIKKRGQELKVFIQEKLRGGVRIAGLNIGRYETDWDKVFEPLKEGFNKFKDRIFLLVTDGDANILKGIKGVKILLQRCLWHLGYQMKYYLWKDKVKRKSKQWYHVLGEIFDISAIRDGVEDEEEIKAIIEAKTSHLDKLIEYCKEHGYRHCKNYLENAKGKMFTALRNKVEGKTTSKVERVMRTVKMRMDVGKWNGQGALNVVRVRLAHYYNGFEATEEVYEREVKVLESAA